uniref:Uncharacterized protein n=1 Tax=Anopheles atroparvus TaxID=41427 RepID=A0A182J644_ANOAO
MSKFFLSVAVLVGHCFLLSAAGRLFYPYQQQRPAEQTGYYLPNYDVLPPQDFNEPAPSPAWQPIVEFPWPAYQPEPHHPPHYHVGPKPPCPFKTTSTRRPTPTTTTTTTTTTQKPTTTTHKHHLKETLVSALHNKY